jgi:hypothetical protein
VPPPGGMTPEQLIQAIANAVAQKIAMQPPKTFEVNRTAPDNQKRVEHVTLPQAIAELSDHLQLSNELKKIEIQQMQGLTQVLEQNRKIGKAVLKRNKKDEDDEDES